MVILKSSGSFQPFKDLEKRIRSQSISLPTQPIHLTRKGNDKSGTYAFMPPEHLKKQIDDSISQEERDLFLEAMKDVKPLSKPPHQMKIKRAKAPPFHIQERTNDRDAEILIRLNRLVHHGEGFVVADTSEYAEWTGFNVNPRITRRLHRGDFSIQSHIDLHGLTVQEAKTVFNTFFKEAVATKKNAILIVHGRGLSSPSEPVLKSKVHEWLISGEYRKWIVAFSSARLCDGGAGATIVLLRQHPLPKRFRKNKKYP